MTMSDLDSSHDEFDRLLSQVNEPDDEYEEQMLDRSEKINDVYGSSTVIAALDQIEDLIESGRTLPMTPSVLVNKAEVLDLLDQARAALPDDLVAADAVINDSDALMRRADEVAQSTVSEAEARARVIVDDATEQAEELTARTREEAEQTRDESLATAREVVERAHQEAEQIITNAREQANHLISQESVTLEARERAEQIIHNAHQRAIDLADGADEYCSQALDDMRRNMSKLLAQTEAGIREIDQRRRERYGDDEQ